MRDIFTGRLSPRISIIYSPFSGTGKSTALSIIAKTLGGEYAFVADLNLLLEDRATKAKIKNKRLVVIQDLPKNWKDFEWLKMVTGEDRVTFRAFLKDTETGDNKMKIWASGNYLSKIPNIHKAQMYTRRLSIINNTRQEPYPENPELIELIVKNESEKIISWILNLSDSECEYENGVIVRKEWEQIASPEIEFLEKYYRATTTESKITVRQIISNCYRITKQKIDVPTMLGSLKALGYSQWSNTIMNIEDAAKDSKNQSLN